MRLAAIRKAIREDPSVTIEVYQSCPYTVAIIRSGDQVGIGVSKVCWPDAFDDIRGWNIATGRAELALAKQLHSVADARPAVWVSTPTTPGVASE